MLGQSTAECCFGTGCSGRAVHEAQCTGAEHCLRHSVWGQSGAQGTQRMGIEWAEQCPRRIVLGQSGGKGTVCSAPALWSSPRTLCLWPCSEHAAPQAAPSTRCLGRRSAQAHSASCSALPEHTAPRPPICPCTRCLSCWVCPGHHSAPYICLRHCSARAHCASGTALADRTVPRTPLCPRTMRLRHYYARAHCASGTALPEPEHTLHTAAHSLLCLSTLYLRPCSARAQSASVRALP